MASLINNAVASLLMSVTQSGFFSIRHVVEPDNEATDHGESDRLGINCSVVMTTKGKKLSSCN